jgi:TRAP-type C4-dicarboxylate transport system substrate-binding protein
VIGVMVIDQRTFNKLDAADQVIVRDAIGKAFRNLDSANKRDNDAARGVLAKQGVQFDQPNADETAYWREVGVNTLRKLQAEGGVSAELLAAIQKAQAEHRAGAGAQ